MLKRRRSSAYANVKRLCAGLCSKRSLAELSGAWRRSFNWTTVQYVQLFDLLVQAMTSLCALFCISTLRDEDLQTEAKRYFIQYNMNIIEYIRIFTEREDSLQDEQWCNSLSIFAGIGLPLVTLTIFMRLGEALAQALSVLSLAGHGGSSLGYAD